MLFPVLSAASAAEINACPERPECTRQRLRPREPAASYAVGSDPPMPCAPWRQPRSAVRMRRIRCDVLPWAEQGPGRIRMSASAGWRADFKRELHGPANVRLRPEADMDGASTFSFGGRSPQQQGKHMEFHPHLLPKSSLGHETGPRLGRIYVAVNCLYAALLFAGTCVLVVENPPPMDRRTFSAVVYLYAPLVCFCVMRRAPAVHVRRFLVAYGAYVLFLVAIFVWTLVTPLSDLPIGALIVGLNALALLAAFLQLRRNALQGAAVSASGR